jgi:hypothetical protein
MRWPWLASAAAAWVSSVDLPMPGSPPISSAEPRTKPPPVARSSSPMREMMRGASSMSPSSDVSVTARPLGALLSYDGPLPKPPALPSTTSLLKSPPETHNPAPPG